MTGHNLVTGHTKSCGNCTQYQISGDTALGTLRDGTEFVVDVEDLSIVQVRKWHAKNGYIRSGNGKTSPRLWLHRYVLGLTDNQVDVDHINGDPRDNRKCNLRISSHVENLRNQEIRCSSVTGYKGVCYSARDQMYRAYINAEGKQQGLGYYRTPEEAAIAYNEAALRFFGEYARINVIGQSFATVSAAMLNKEGDAS